MPIPGRDRGVYSELPVRPRVHGDNIQLCFHVFEPIRPQREEDPLDGLKGLIDARGLPASGALDVDLQPVCEPVENVRIASVSASGRDADGCDQRVAQ